MERINLIYLTSPTCAPVLSILIRRVTTQHSQLAEYKAWHTGESVTVTSASWGYPVTALNKVEVDQYFFFSISLKNIKHYEELDILQIRR